MAPPWSTWPAPRCCPGWSTATYTWPSTPRTIPSPGCAERDDAAAFAAMTAFARAAARGGVTTVRDLGDRGYLSLGLRGAAATDPTLPRHPRLRAADHHARRALPLPRRAGGRRRR